MAVNIFDKYGIKEVANVYFEALATDTNTGVYEGDIVLFLDTLKVSTIETTAENVAAQGGWGNPRLISWDYGKEINITLTDALMSLESLRFMMGGTIKKAKAGQPVKVRRTAEVVVKAGGLLPEIKDKWGAPVGTITGSATNPIRVINLTQGYRTQIIDGNKLEAGKKVTFVNPAAGIASQEAVEGDRLRIFWTEERASEDAGKGAVEVTISPDTFPGTYRVVGDTFMRSQKTGQDEPFQFVIEKAKVQSNVTLTLEAEGDPTTFEMTLQVLRDESGEEMMKLIRYDTENDSTKSSGNDFGSLSNDG